MSEPASKKRKFQDIDTVLFIVGEAKALFRVHRNLIIEKSRVFKATFENMRFKKGLDQKMKLEEEDEEVFDLFVQWLYWGEQSLPKLERLHEDDTELMLCVKLCVFADARQIVDLQCSLMDRLVQAIDREAEYVPSIKVVTYVYSNVTAGNSATRELLADWVGWHGSEDWDNDDKIAELLEVPAFAKRLVYSLAYFFDRSPKHSEFPRGAEVYYGSYGNIW